MTGKITRTSMLGASCVGILIGAAALLWSPMAEAQGTFSPVPQIQQTQPGKIDRTLSGSRKGMLSKAKGGIVSIDGVTYVLAPGALVENKFGDSVAVQGERWENVEFDVQYWIGTGAADKQITQMIIYFPE